MQATLFSLFLVPYIVPNVISELCSDFYNIVVYIFGGNDNKEHPFRCYSVFYSLVIDKTGLV